MTGLAELKLYLALKRFLDMPSSVVQNFSYDNEHSRLTVTFVSGRVYEYYLVPPSVAAGLRTSRSKGIYFNKFIRDRYHCRETKAA